MNISSKKLLLGAVCTAGILAQQQMYARIDDIFEEMHKNMEAMREQMNHMFDAFGSMAPTKKDDSTAVSLEETKDGVTIRVPVEGAENFDSSVHDGNRLVIIIPSHGIKITVATEGNWLSVKSSRNQSENNKKDKESTSSSFYSSSSQTLSLSEQVSLDNVDLNYADNVLSINLPRKTGKKVEVKVKK